MDCCSGNSCNQLFIAIEISLFNGNTKQLFIAPSFQRSGWLLRPGSGRTVKLGLRCDSVLRCFGVSAFRCFFPVFSRFFFMIFSLFSFSSACSCFLGFFQGCNLSCSAVPLPRTTKHGKRSISKQNHCLFQKKQSFQINTF